MIYVLLLVAWLLRVILRHAARLLLLSRSRPEAWGAAFGVAEGVPPEQPTASDDPCAWGTEQLDTQFLIWHNVCSLLAFLECLRCG